MNIGSRFKIENNRIVKISNGEILPDDEPLFLMRARDLAALPGLRDYFNRCAERGADQWQLESLAKEIDKFADFAERQRARMKVPGITHGK